MTTGDLPAVPDITIENPLEMRRACGYRSAGPLGFGIYLVTGDGVFRPCSRLPFPLRPCSDCGHTYHHQRSPIGINPSLLFSADKLPRCKDGAALGHSCWFASPHQEYGLLLWVGADNYRPDESHDSGKTGQRRGFCEEADEMGISRRIPWLPDDFKPGVTPVFLCHVHAVPPDSDHHSGLATDWRGKEVMHAEPGVFGACFPTIDIVVDTDEVDELPDHVLRLWDKFAPQNTADSTAIRIVRPIYLDDDGEPINS